MRERVCIIVIFKRAVALLYICWYDVEQRVMTRHSAIIHRILGDDVVNATIRAPETVDATSTGRSTTSSTPWETRGVQSHGTSR